MFFSPIRLSINQSIHLRLFDMTIDWWLFSYAFWLRLFCFVSFHSFIFVNPIFFLRNERKDNGFIIDDDDDDNRAYNKLSILMIMIMICFFFNTKKRVERDDYDDETTMLMMIGYKSRKKIKSIDWYTRLEYIWIHLNYYNFFFVHIILCHKWMWRKKFVWKLKKKNNPNDDQSDWLW